MPDYPLAPQPPTNRPGRELDPGPRHHDVRLADSPSFPPFFFPWAPDTGACPPFLPHSQHMPDYLLVPQPPQPPAYGPGRKLDPGPCHHDVRLTDPACPPFFSLGALHEGHAPPFFPSQHMPEYPLVPQPPTYGPGRELDPGPRENGTIDGNGRPWWEAMERKSLHHMRPHVIEIQSSCHVAVSHLTLVNAPFWFIRPLYSSHLSFRHLTISCPSNVRQTDGIDPDSSTHVLIEDCHVSTGDDAVAIKSGWDQYGYNAHPPAPSADITVRRVTVQCGESPCSAPSHRSGGCSAPPLVSLCLLLSPPAPTAPSADITVRRVTVQVFPGSGGVGLSIGSEMSGGVQRVIQLWNIDLSASSSPHSRAHTNEQVPPGSGGVGLSIGSEMSGGVERVIFEDCRVLGADVGIRIKSAAGRGGFVKK
ncbi:unnamed protein product [Closterium sp. Naga37s-1]|nr:unnamed protein product [Closterium sp. Naga37s-1]